MAKARSPRVRAKASAKDTKGVVAPSVPGAPTKTATVGTTASPSGQRKTVGSYDIFNFCIERAQNLLKLHKAVHGKAGKPERYAADAHRAAIVLAVSALDAFVRAFVLDRTRDLLVDRAKALPSALADEIKKLLKDDSLLEAARKSDLTERVEKALRSDFERRSFQGTKAIRISLTLVGFEDVFHDVAASAGMNEENLCRELDGFTQRRHAIAHRGDYDLSQNPPTENVVTKKDAEDCIRLICKIAKHVHTLSSQS